MRDMVILSGVFRVQRPGGLAGRQPSRKTLVKRQGAADGALAEEIVQEIQANSTTERSSIQGWIKYWERDDKVPGTLRCRGSINRLYIEDRSR